MDVSEHTDEKSVGIGGKERKRWTFSQRRFFEEYLVDHDASAAAIRAGYSRQNAGKLGPRLAALPHISDAIRRSEEGLSRVTYITQGRVLRELARLAFSDVTHYTVDDDGNLALAPGAPSYAMRAVQSVKRKVHYDSEGNVIGRDVEFKLWDKVAPLRQAGKHVGLFKDKLEVTGKDGAPIQAQLAGMDNATLLARIVDAVVSNPALRAEVEAKLLAAPPPTEAELVQEAGGSDEP